VLIDVHRGLREQANMTKETANRPAIQMREIYIIAEFVSPNSAVGSEEHSVFYVALVPGPRRIYRHPSRTFETTKKNTALVLVVDVFRRAGSGSGEQHLLAEQQQK
jgi:hypothetical protein